MKYEEEEQARLRADEEVCLSEEAKKKAEEHTCAQWKVEEGVRLALEAIRRKKEEEHKQIDAEEEEHLIEA